MDETLRFSAKMGIPDDVVSRIRRETKIIIIADLNAAGSYSGQIMLETSANILARMFPNLEVKVPLVKANYLKSDIELNEHLITTIRNAYRWDGYNETEALKEVYLIVGNSECELSSVYIDADGWVSYVGQKPSGINIKENDTVPIGAVVAACLGSAEIFKLLFEDVTNRPCFRVENCIWLNTLTYDDSPVNPSIEDLFLDRVVLFGAGSVGSSMLYTLGFLSNISGSIDIVDRDKKVDYANLQRYTSLTVSDVAEFQGVSKSRWAASKLSLSLPSVTAIPWEGELGTITSFLDSRPVSPGINIAISAVDNTESRIQIVDCLAKRTINAGTGDTTLTITRHGFADGRACLACEYIGQLPNVSWYQEVSNKIGVPVDRVAVLLDGKDVLTEFDTQLMKTAGFIDISQQAELVGTDLSSLINRRLYSAVAIQSGVGQDKPFTAPFVSLMAGALLAGELIKELSDLQSGWTSNKYRTDLLSTPAQGGSYVIKAPQGCLCHNGFRVGKYRSLWTESDCG